MAAKISISRNFSSLPDLKLVGKEDMLIHEFAHDYSSDHLSEAYYDALSDLGGRLTQLALEDPALFAKHGAKIPQEAV